MVKTTAEYLKTANDQVTAQSLVKKLAVGIYNAEIIGIEKASLPTNDNPYTDETPVWLLQFKTNVGIHEEKFSRIGYLRFDELVDNLEEGDNIDEYFESKEGYAVTVGDDKNPPTRLVSEERTISANARVGQIVEAAGFETGEKFDPMVLLGKSVNITIEVDGTYGEKITRVKPMAKPETESTDLL